MVMCGTATQCITNHYFYFIVYNMYTNILPRSNINNNNVNASSKNKDSFTSADKGLPKYAS